MSQKRGAKGPGYREPSTRHSWDDPKIPWAARKKTGSLGRRSS